MNLVPRLLPLNHVLLGLEAGSKKRLFEQIGLLFENSRQIPRSRVFDALFEREPGVRDDSDSRALGVQHRQLQQLTQDHGGLPGSCRSHERPASARTTSPREHRS